ncbi:MAG: hormogonium polysaccharide biosynthesis protein HpsA [Coleofasciculaceae cyanobacterium]
MSRRKKQFRLVRSLFKQIGRLSKAISKAIVNWLLRSLMILGRRRSRLAQAGFVLPTVVMVTLVVVLLTTAIMFRSFDRSKNASNVRVNEVVLRAAEPALDRARAKMDALFDDPSLPRSTPSEGPLSGALSTARYQFPDEERLTVSYDINGGGVNPDTSVSLVDQETINSAWRFPVDTDNNGSYDSLTLYGIYFRSPQRNPTTGDFNRPRNPLEARTPPMDNAGAGGICEAAVGTSAGLVGSSSWYKADGKLKKSFFVFVASVPITDKTGLPGADKPYEIYKGNQGFSALEYQQDRALIPLSNNAVWFDDDIDISRLPTFRLNGRVFSNSNLLVGAGNADNPVTFYQVSSPDSCYYEAENAKIVIAGNVANGGTTSTADAGGNVNVHLFKGKGLANDPTKVGGGVRQINSTNKTIEEAGGSLVAYNSLAYEERLKALVDEAQAAGQLKGDTSKTDDTFTFYREITRRVPYDEVGVGGDAIAGAVFGTDLDGTILPPPEWMQIDNNNLDLKYQGADGIYLLATNPNDAQEVEDLLGDRIKFGNGLPKVWYDNGDFRTDPQPIVNGANNVVWNGGVQDQRTRESLIQEVPDLGKSSRDGFWEKEAAKQPDNSLDNTGGLRIVTGAGIYVDQDNPADGGAEFIRQDITPANFDKTSFLPYPSLMPGLVRGTDVPTDAIITWPDTLPMTGGLDEVNDLNRKGDLLMRATAVYHYRGEAGQAQLPIACVSSYYDPTNATTARNTDGLPDVSGGLDDDTDPDTDINVLADGLAPGTQPTTAEGARSNNGVSYPAPLSTEATYVAQLARQAKLVFPNGRSVNPLLGQALAKADRTSRTWAENSAIDSAVCALDILNASITPSDAQVPHGAIKEAAFLNAREVKSINAYDPDALDDTELDGLREAETIPDLEKLRNNGNLTAINGTLGIPAFDSAPTSYTLPLEQRQPLEVRVTEIDLNLLRGKSLGGAPTEYLLPNSGIIYATRDDALPDRSNATLADGSDGSPQESAVDFQLDPTRRASGIRLINGSNLARDTNYRIEEKGLILATDLPVYILGDFNLHDHEEFTNELDPDWGDFYTRTAALINPNFACRVGQTPDCTGDNWRPATIISDSVTLLSRDNPGTADLGGFKDGFRNQGDFDLRNNIGNLAVDSRLSNGFWFNNFVTSANDWFAANGLPAEANKNSYLTNGVTPIQRRAEEFPEYVMEICRKVPVSECGPSDWVVGYDVNGDGNLYQDTNANGIIEAAEYDVNTIPGLGTIREIDIKANQLGQVLTSLNGGARVLNNTNIATVSGAKNDLSLLGAGTTASSALEVDERRFARRVAFARNERDLLVTVPVGTGQVAKPLGVGCPLDPTGTTFAGNGCTYPAGGNFNVNTHYGKPADNALWFRTTENKNGNPGALGNIKYRDDRPLYYNTELETDLNSSENQVLLPGIPEPQSVPALARLNGNDIEGFTANDPSDYAVCTAVQDSQAYAPTPGGNCPAPTVTRIGLAVDALLTLTPDLVDGWNGIDPKILDATTPENALELPNLIRDVDNNGVYVYELPATGLAQTTAANLTLRGTAGTIFVLKAPAGSPINFGNGVNLTLDGVDPNNLFWVSDTGMDFGSASNQLAGNFLGKGSLSITASTKIIGGRILGFATGSVPTGTLTAMTATQPQLTPILQIHSPGVEGQPDNNINEAFEGLLEENNWLQKAETTIFNAVFVTGDSPSKPNEWGGGLGNFVRFLESWGTEPADRQTAEINGSFIQTRKSSYTTAPLLATNPTLEATLDTSLFYDGAGTPHDKEGGFKYRGGAVVQGAPYYMPPTRTWGFDVGLLTQLPDLFSQRFTQPPAGEPDEFFREVSRDDQWVQTLLCAKTATGNALPDDQRPTQFCTANTGG